MSIRLVVLGLVAHTNTIGLDIVNDKLSKS